MTTSKKKVRRVRVIEVLEDEDLDDEEVLRQAVERADARQESDEREHGKGENGDAQDDHRDDGDRDDKTEVGDSDGEGVAGAERAGGDAEDEDAAGDDVAIAELVGEDAGNAEDAGADSGDSGDSGGEESDGAAGSRHAASRSLRSPGVLGAAAVVAVVVLAAVAVWQWRTADRLSENVRARTEAAEVAGRFGNVVLSFSGGSLQASIDQNLALMGGDLHKNFAASSKNLSALFTRFPGLVLTSKIKRVYLAEVSGSQARAVISVDVTLRSPQGDVDQPDTLFRLSLARTKGAWKVTQYRGSGQGDESTGGNQLPTLPTPTPSATKAN